MYVLQMISWVTMAKTFQRIIYSSKVTKGLNFCLQFYSIPKTFINDSVVEDVLIQFMTRRKAQLNVLW